MRAPCLDRLVLVGAAAPPDAPIEVQPWAVVAASPSCARDSSGSAAGVELTKRQARSVTAALVLSKLPEQLRELVTSQPVGLGLAF